MNWSVYKYVQKKFQENFIEWYIMNNDQRKGFTTLVNKLLENGYKISDIKNGLHDDEIAKELNEYINGYFTVEQRKDCIKLCEYVYELSRSSDMLNFKVKYSNDMLDYIVKQVITELFPQYYEARLGTKEFEQVVISKYKDIYIGIYNDVHNKIKTYLDATLDFYQVSDNMDFNNLVNYVTSQILGKSDRDFVVSICNYKMGNSKNKSNIENVIDSHVNYYLSSNKRKVSTEKKVDKQEETIIYKMSDLTDHISRLVMNNYQGISDNLLNSCVRVVQSRLIFDGYDINKIVSGDIDNIIDSYVIRFFDERRARINAAKNSVKNDKVPPKIKPKKNVRKMNQSIVALVLAATLLGTAANGVYEMVTDIHNYNAKKNVSMIDDHYYANINTRYAQSFEPTANNIIDTFDDYSQFDNENFKYLGFYQAYRSVKEDRLYIMDNMLSDIKRDVRNNDNYRSLYASIMYNGCYLDFMYDRLYEMGFEEIKEDKYQDLLDEYFAVRNEYPNSDVVKYLSPSQQRLLEKVRDKYIELSEKHLVELGELLGSEDYAPLEGAGRSL